MRSGKWVNLLFLAVTILALLGWAFRPKIQAFFVDADSFQLHDITLEDMLGYAAKIQPGYRGYVIFYADMDGCTTCLDKLGHLKEVSKQFDEVGYYAILKDQNRRQSFNNLMIQYEFPGESLLDPNHIIESKLALSKHPQLMFFDRESHLIAAIPLDIDHDSLIRQYFRYLEEM